MAPEMYVRKEPKDGLQPDGTVRIDFNGDSDYVVRYREHLSDGIGMVFKNRGDVAEVLIKLAKYVKFGQKETEERKPELIETVAAALVNANSFEEDEELYVRFTHEEVRGIEDGPVVTFASQKVVNETFLKLLPHAELVHGTNSNNDVDAVREVLGPLNLLIPDVLKQLRKSVVAQGTPEYPEMALKAVSDIEKSLSASK